MTRAWYPTPPLSEDKLREAVKAVEVAVEAGCVWPNPQGANGRSALREAAEALGLPRATLEHRIERAGRKLGLWPMGIDPGWEPRKDLSYAERKARKEAREGKAGFAPVMPGFEAKAVTNILNEAGDVVRTTIRQSQAAEREFELPEGRRIGKVTTQISADGRIEKEWVRHNTGDDPEAVMKAAAQAFEAYRGWAKLPPPPDHLNDDLLVIYPVADLHLRMLSWGAETGEDYDIPIAVELIRNTFGAVVHQCPRAKNAVILGLGDILHADNDENRTRRSGNALDTDTRYAKGLDAAVFLLRGMIEMALQHHETVTVRLCEGNHDETSTVALRMAMVGFFWGHDRVIVDTDPSPYWFARFGKNLFGAHHGHLSKPGQWAGIMASHRPQDWGETTFRHFMSGHLHHKQRGGEENGMTWEIFQTPAPRDAYHAGKGYWAGRSMCARVFHREEGFLTGPQVNIIPSLRRAQAIGDKAA